MSIYTIKNTGDVLTVFAMDSIIKRMLIDNADRQIILALQNNGRTSYAQMARHLGVSPATVAKRVASLGQEGVITIRALPNPMKLGYTANALLALNVDLTKINDVCKRLADNFNVNLIHTSFGRFDLFAFVYFPSWEKLHEFISLELSKVDGVRKIEAFFVDEIKKRYGNIFSDFSTDESRYETDELDMGIITALVKNGRYSGPYLAGNLGTSVATISRRISLLESQNIIKIKALPNPAKFGQLVGAFIALTVEIPSIDYVCSQLAGYEEIHMVMTMINGSNIFADIHCATTKELYEIVMKKLAHIKGVINVETFLCAELKKRYYGWLLPE